MLYQLHVLAEEGWQVFFIFESVTFRAAFGALFAFLLCVTLGPHLIAFLRRKKIEEDVSKKDSKFLVKHHEKKRHTPTMGGVIMVGAALASILLFARLDVPFITLSIFTLFGFALLGFYDDWVKLNRKGAKGLSIKGKLAFQGLMGGLIGWALVVYNQTPHASTVVVPLLASGSWWVLGSWYFLWASMVITGSSNAVNLTDGLDGLATICTITVAVALGLMAYFAGHAGIAGHLDVVRIPGAQELTVVCSSLAGACLGFLWFNAHPADIFMGDTGSLPLGALIGLVALCIKQELMLVVIGGVFVIEALSVLIQIASFRLFGRRVFLIAPLHHHFEKLGWSETKIVARFFIVSVLLAVLSVALLRLG